MATSNTFGYSVLVSDPFPENVDEPLPNEEPYMFSPLTCVFATHGHGDHWFTAPVLAERFGAQVVASAATIKQMHVNAFLCEAFYDKLVSGIPRSPVTAVIPPGNRLTLEGHELIIVEVGHADTDDSSVLHAPDLGLVAAGDVLYNGVHRRLTESGSGGRDAWRTAIDIIAALEPRWTVAGHNNKGLGDDAAHVIAETRQYLDDAEELLRENSTASGFFNAVIERYPNRLGRTAVWNTARALYGSEHQMADWQKPERRPDAHGNEPIHAGEPAIHNHTYSEGIRQWTGLMR